MNLLCPQNTYSRVVSGVATTILASRIFFKANQKEPSGIIGLVWRLEASGP
jgi:hypothetical protein